MDEVAEGSTKIVLAEKSATFYNPIQEFNRDLTVTVLRVFSETRLAQKNEQMEMDGTPIEDGKPRMNELREQNAGGLRILDALSASGLRAIRFAKEVPGVDLVVANDFSEQTFQTIQRNVQLNEVEDRVKPTHSDAIDLMMEHRKLEKRFHAIDLDPYGSASLFLDSAVQAVVDGGILMVTCTDMAILCGNCPEACFAKYGSVPIRHKSSCHEMALRILLRAIDSHANRHGRFIQPLLSISVDFYIRCFVRVQSGAAKAKDSLTRLAQVFSCARCQSLDFQPLIRKSVHGQSVHFTAPHFASNLVRQFGKEGGNDKENAEENCGKCIHCGCTAIHVGGPIYTGPIHCTEFVHKMMNSLKQTLGAQRLGTAERLEGVLTLVLEELEDRPLCLDHSQLMAAVKCPTMLNMGVFRRALLNGGFRCSGSHSNPNGLKTDAPMQFVWDICRAWAKKSAINVGKLKDATAKEILGREQIFAVNFALHRDAIPASKSANILRFQDNKGKNWGPKTRVAKGNGTRRGGTPKKGTNGPEMPKTPEHYWDIDFPSPGEQVRRGYITYATSPLFKKQQKSHSAPVKRRLVVDFSEEN